MMLHIRYAKNVSMGRPVRSALEILADEANAMPPDALPGAWQELALRFAETVRGSEQP